MSIIYGPVWSRRFRHSLGIDIIPFKICSYDCVYCQLGKTTEKTIERKRYMDIDMDGFREELGKTIDRAEKIDYITFSGCGEPTLNTDIKELIKNVKKTTDIPVIVLTNGSLLFMDEVMDSISEADYLKISFDGPNQDILDRIDYPDKKIIFTDILKGLKNANDVFKGRIFLEIMLIKGINDSIETAHEFKSVIDDIFGTERKGIKKIHLNTPVRPTGINDVMPPVSDRLDSIKDIIGKKVELINAIEAGSGNKKNDRLERDIMEMVKRRPASINDMSNALMVSMNEVIKCINELIKNGRISFKLHNNKKYYYARDI